MNREHSTPEEWNELISHHLAGQLSESDKERLVELLDSNTEARQLMVEQSQWESQLSEVLREKYAQSASDTNSLESDEVSQPLSIGRKSSSTKFSTLSLIAIAVSILFFLFSANFWFQTNTDPAIAKITDLSGSLVWTGNGGQIVRDLTLGTELSGGTIEGMTPDSLFKLQFTDGSTVMISGNSILTFSDNGQKILRLKEGSFSANVKPQPKDKPMLVHTRTALLKVLGTQFNVDASLATTVLNVNEGQVRLLRLSDNQEVDVPSQHRVVASSESDLSLERVPESVTQWRSHIDLGRKRLHGEWKPARKSYPAHLTTVPYTTKQGKTIYTLGQPVSFGDNPPVVLQADSKLRVKGHITSQHSIWFGLTLRRVNGEFAGRFQIIKPATEIQKDQEFAMEFNISDFHLDPSLNETKHALPSKPDGLIVANVWCHSLYDQAGLAIHSLELKSGPD